MDKLISQHKRAAMGDSRVGFARGGRVLKSGVPDTPLEKAKRANGVPGMKTGGKAKGPGCA